MHLRLENFDGPLDLLLHLIKTQEINIFNIPIVFVTEQYLAFLRQAPDFDFLSAGEYVAMAAQLIEIKAFSLMPVLQQKEAKSIEDIPEDDPRKALILQLIDYESIKKACVELDKLVILGRDVFPSGEVKRREQELENLAHPIKGDAFSLVIAFEGLLLKFAEKKSAPVVRVRAQAISIHEKISQLKKRFERTPSCEFTHLMDDCVSRYELIVIIMAVLELTKANQLCLAQDEIFGPIHITRGKKFFDDVPQIDGEPATEQSARG